MSDEPFKPGDLRSWLSRSESMTPAFESFLSGKRWFAGKAETVRSVEVTECIPFEIPGAVLLLIQVRYQSASEQSYALPLKTVALAERTSVEEGGPSRDLVIAPQSPEGVLSDALEDRAFAELLLRIIRDRTEVVGAAGKLIGTAAGAIRDLLPASAGALKPSVLRAEQSNTSINYGGRLILKFFRRPEEGINLDFETGRFLTEKAGFQHVPPVAGSLEYLREGRPPVTLAVLQGYVENRGDAWKYTLEMLDAYLGRMESSKDAPPAALPEVESSGGLTAGEPPALARDVIGEYLSNAALLGRRTAELHLALSSDTLDPEFAPEPFTAPYRHELAREMNRFADQARRLLRERERSLDTASQEKARFILAHWDVAFDGFQRLLERPITAERTRVHGDYHLGQVLFTGTDFMIIDFEGEPERPLAERRAKHSPLRDVAGMLRSFHYAASTAVARRAQTTGGSARAPGHLRRFARFWRDWVGAEFLRAYLETSRGAPFLPRDSGALRALLDFLLVEKTTYELVYELNNRPAWAPIPLDGLIELAERAGVRD
ncbi:MAG: putative maltokinase [Terriglobia bacterium]